LSCGVAPVWEKAGNAAAIASGNTARRTEEIQVFMGSTFNKMPSPASPPVHERYERAAKSWTCAFTLLAGIRADGTAIQSPSQARVQNAQWLMMKAECVLKFESQGAAFVRLPLRGQRRLEIAALGKTGLTRTWRR